MALQRDLSNEGTDYEDSPDVNLPEDLSGMTDYEDSPDVSLPEDLSGMSSTEEGECRSLFEDGAHMEDPSNEVLSENIQRNLEWPCTAEEDKTCQIVDHLPSLNKLLCSIGLRLRELSDGDGQLAVVDSQAPGFTLWHEPGTLEAFGLLSWLLKTHSCVTFLHVNDVFLRKFQEGVLQGVLDGNSSLKSLKVDSSYSKGVSKIISSVAQLQKLEVLSHDLDIKVAEAISEALRTKTLTTLDLSVPACTNDAFVLLVAALKENSTVRELSVSDSLCTNILARESNAFTEYLEQNSVLDKLNVHANNYGIMQCTLTGMCRNRSVSKLNLFGCGVGDRVFLLLRDMFFYNTVLRSFTISNVADYFVFRDFEGFDECLRCLAGNSELQHMKLPFTMIPRGGWSQIFEIVSTHRSLKELTVELSENEYDKVLVLERYGLHHGLHEDLFEACKCLENSAAKHKVRFTFETFDPHMRALDNVASVELVVPLAGRGIRSKPMNLLRQFCSFGSGRVTQLRLELSRLEGHSLDAAQFIQETTTLKKLFLSSDTRQDVPSIDNIWSTISESLSQNTSIRELDVTVYTEWERAENLKRLLDVVQSSKTIRRLSVKLYPFSDISWCNVESSTAEVSKNYALCSFRLLCRRTMTPESVWFAWYNMAWRNAGIVARAADYVKLTRCDGRCAGAMETVSRHPALMEELAEVLSVSDAVAAYMVTTRLSHIQDMHAFMRVAGVVQHRVTCHPREDGRKQLQDLNEYCWKHLRRYLRLDDICYSSKTTGDTALK